MKRRGVRLQEPALAGCLGSFQRRLFKNTFAFKNLFFERVQLASSGVRYFKNQRLESQRCFMEKKTLVKAQEAGNDWL